MTAGKRAVSRAESNYHNSIGVHMLAINWIALALSIVVHIICQYIGHGVAMASSGHEEGSVQDIYLGRVQSAAGIAQLGAIASFISQLIPVPIVRTVGLIILAISILSIVVIWSGLLRLRLPDTDLTEEGQ